MVFSIIPTKQVNKRGGPLLNERFSSGYNYGTRARDVSKALFSDIKSIPEMIGILDTLVTDHFQGEVDFFDTNGRPLGRNKLKQIKQWWERNNVMQSFQGAGHDYFIDGSAFMWHPTLNQTDSFKEIRRKLNGNAKLMSAIKQLGVDMQGMIDEEGNIPRFIDYVAASTMEIIHDSQNILGYIQDASGKRIPYSREEITHLKLMELNGEVRGYSGFKALCREVSMLWMLKENIISSLDNGGSPDAIISLKNANGISRQRFNQLRSALETFSHLRSSHGNLALDAEVQVQQLGTMLKDMEYRELAMYVLSEFCLAMGMPTSRVPFLMTGAGGTANKGELAGDAEKAYQSKINNRRLYWENVLNEGIFKKMGFTFRFRRDNLQDEVKETQATQMRYASIGELQNILARAGMKMEDQTLLELASGKKMDISQIDVVKLEGNEMLNIGPQFNAQNAKASEAEMGSGTTQARSESREKSANNRGEFA